MPLAGVLLVRVATRRRQGNLRPTTLSLEPSVHQHWLGALGRTGLAAIRTALASARALGCWL